MLNPSHLVFMVLKLFSFTYQELGGLYESGPNWTPYAIRDGNLVRWDGQIATVSSKVYFAAF